MRGGQVPQTFLSGRGEIDRAVAGRKRLIHVPLQGPGREPRHCHLSANLKACDEQDLSSFAPSLVTRRPEWHNLSAVWPVAVPLPPVRHRANGQSSLLKYQSNFAVDHPSPKPCQVQASDSCQFRRQPRTLCQRSYGVCWSRWW